jgi:hypothetical protein
MKVSAIWHAWLMMLLRLAGSTDCHVSVCESCQSALDSVSKVRHELDKARGLGLQLRGEKSKGAKKVKP